MHIFPVAALLSSLLISLSLAVPAAAPSRFEAVAQRAEAARIENRVPEAIQLYREGTRMRPSWADGWWYLGSLLYDQDRFSEAAVDFQHLLTDPGYHGSAHAFLGLCEYEIGRNDDALTEFRAWAGAGWPGTFALRDVASYHFALLLTREGQFLESLSLLTWTAQRLGDTPELAEAIGLASLRMPYLPENYPPELRERIWLAGKAALYAELKPAQFDRADDFAARLETRYSGQPEIHAFRGTLYGFEKKPTDAEREYREELKISASHLPSLLAVIGFDFSRGDTAEAEEFARRAMAAEPNSAEAHHQLGRILLAKGDLAMAVKELETAKQLMPKNPSVRYHLATAYGRLGRKEDAKAEFISFEALKKRAEASVPIKLPAGVAQEK